MGKKRSSANDTKDPTGKRHKVEKLSKIRVMTAADLEIQEGVLPLSEIFGLENIKQTLEKCIGIPLRSHQHYMVNFGNPDQPTKVGKLPLQRFLALYGAQESGKASVVKSFCQHNNLSLIEIPHWDFHPVDDMEDIYTAAYEESKSSPCVIMFDSCDGNYQPESNLFVVGKMRTLLDKIRSSNRPIWVIFLSTTKPGKDTLHHIIYSLIDECTWTGFLSEGATIEAIQSCIKRFMHPKQTFPLSERDVKAIAEYCDNVVVGNIYRYIAKVFYLRTELNEEQGKLESLDCDSDEMLPIYDDFVNDKCCYTSGGKNRITTYDPLTYNIMPYYNESRNIHEINYGLSGIN